jgi:gliding motility-associated protein GldM
MAGKETPRQRMIGVMYLVLLALLALNVSKEVLDAFAIVNQSVLQTSHTLSQKLKDLHANFDMNYEFNESKVKPFWKKAQKAKKHSKEMVVFIKSLRNELVAKTENLPLDSVSEIMINELAKKDNSTVPTNFFLGTSQTGSRGKAALLKERLQEYRDSMFVLLDPRFIESVKFSLSTDGPYYNADGIEENWETHFFYNTILAADITILNKMVIDVLNAEFDVVNTLHKSIGQGDFKFDKIEAKILPESDIVFVGDDYKAQIIVAAYDSTQSPEVFYMDGVDSLPVSQLNQANKIIDKGGTVTIHLPARSVGPKRFAGFARVKSGVDTIKDYHFHGEYRVAQPSITISATNMNVFYSGVENPVSIAVSGVIKENIFPSISCGTIVSKPFGSDWIVNVPPECKNATIQISALINGERKIMGIQKFRVKKLPDPKASISGKTKGSINKEIMVAAASLIAEMPDDFEFTHSFVIKSFTLTIQRGFKTYNFKSENAELTSQMVEQINRTNRGQRIVFEDIIAVDQFGDLRTLSPLVLNIQ